MYKEFEKKVNSLKLAINGKKVILWGYGVRGRIFEDILRIHNRSIDAIIDMNDNMLDIKVKTSCILEYFDPSITAILFVPNVPVQSIEHVLKQHHFETADVIHITNFFYENNKDGYSVDYYNWAEYEFGIDLCQGKNSYGIDSRILYDKGELCHRYWPFSGAMLKLVLSEFCFSENDAVFDYGCGKGGALTMFADAGVRHIGGIELDSELYQIACQNMEKCGIRHNIVCGDASEYKEIDQYNIFFFFDPFEGEIFEKVIKNIETSFLKHGRKIIIIYAAPRCHESVIRNGIFKYTQQYETFHCFTKTTNVYISTDWCNH